MNIQDKVIIVTGASSGIGAATARLLGQRGAKVVLAARRTERLLALSREIPESLAVTVDVTQPGAVDELVARTMEQYGRVDALVNNAGQGLHVGIEQIKLDDYRAIMELNVYAPLRLMQAVVPLMRAGGGGSIVNISSGTTKMVLPGVAAYASTKAALNMLSQVAREELAADKIVVSLVYPYITKTEFHDVLRDHAPVNAAQRAQMPEGHSAEFVAEYILHSLQTGETEIVLRPGMARTAV